MNNCGYDSPPYYLSAYSLACKRGFVGTLDEWLMSLTAYGLAVEKGFRGTQEEWLASLQGKSAYQYAVEAGYAGSEEAFVERLTQPGKTAYEYAKDGGFTGTIEDFQKKLAEEHLLMSGGTMSGDIAMSGHKVTGLGTPTEDGDAVSKSAMDNALKEKLSSTSPVPVAKGGTEATDAAGARANLGAVYKAGDTMTGRLILPYLRLDPDSLYPIFEIFSKGIRIGSIKGNDSNRRLQLANDCADTDYQEIFSTPSASSGLTADKYYEFLTTKSTVTLAQGGTGATTAAGARANLGVEDTLKISSVWTNSSPDSTFAAQTITLSAASGLDVAFWIVEYRYMASDGGSVNSTIAFNGHGTTVALYNDNLKSRNIQITGTSAVFKDCYSGSTVSNSYFVPYRIYAVHKA